MAQRWYDTVPFLSVAGDWIADFLASDAVSAVATNTGARSVKLATSSVLDAETMKWATAPIYDESTTYGQRIMGEFSTQIQRAPSWHPSIMYLPKAFAIASAKQVMEPLQGSNSLTEALTGLGNRVDVASDYLLGTHSLPKVVEDTSPQPIGVKAVDQRITFSPKQKSMLRGAIVALPGLKSSLLRPAIGLHLASDALAGYLDFRNPRREAYEGLPAMLEPYLMMTGLALLSKGSELWDGLAESLKS